MFFKIPSVTQMKTGDENSGDTKSQYQEDWWVPHTGRGSARCPRVAGRRLSTSTEWLASASTARLCRSPALTFKAHRSRVGSPPTTWRHPTPPLASGEPTASVFTSQEPMALHRDAGDCGLGLAPAGPAELPRGNLSRRRRNPVGLALFCFLLYAVFRGGVSHSKD